MEGLWENKTKPNRQRAHRRGHSHFLLVHTGTQSVLRVCVSGAGLSGLTAGGIPMRAVGVTRSAALSTGCSEHFREEEKGRPSHRSDPKGAANATLVPTPDAKRR